MGDFASFSMKETLREQPVFVGKPFFLKLMGGYTGVFADFYDHARECRVQQLMAERCQHRREGADTAGALPVVPAPTLNKL